MKRTFCAIALFALLALPNLALAQESTDPTGTWRWTVNFGGNESERVLTLALEDGALTGTINGFNDSVTEISDAKYEDGKVTFRVVRNFNGNEFAIDYSGTVSGDTLTGQTRSMFNGEERNWDWTAVRDSE